MARRIEPGSQWVLRRGDHSGSVVEVDARTEAGTVKYHVTEAGNSTGTGGSKDGARGHTRSEQEFLTLFRPRAKPSGAYTQSAFRQHNVPKERPVVAATKRAISQNGTT